MSLFYSAAELFKRFNKSLRKGDIVNLKMDHSGKSLLIVEIGRYYDGNLFCFRDEIPLQYNVKSNLLSDFFIIKRICNKFEDQYSALIAEKGKATKVLPIIVPKAAWKQLPELHGSDGYVESDR